MSYQPYAQYRYDGMGIGSERQVEMATGMVGEFEQGITNDQARQILRDAMTIVDGKAVPLMQVLRVTDVRDFNPDHGSPVFYVP